MNGTETITYVKEIDLKSSILSFFSSSRIITRDSQINEMCFKLKNASSAFAQKRIVFDVHFRERLFTLTIDLATDVFQVFGNSIDFTIDNLTEINLSVFEKTMGKIILKGQVIQSLSRD